MLFNKLLGIGLVFIENVMFCVRLDWRSIFNALIFLTPFHFRTFFFFYGIGSFFWKYIQIPFFDLHEKSYVKIVMVGLFGCLTMKAFVAKT